MIRTILIDDENNALEVLEILLKKYCPNVEILEKCNGGKAGIDAIEKHQPDLVFLDIEMPHINGFDVLTATKNYKYKVIFTTAYNQFAIKAFKFSAIDYLLKPIDFEELKEAVNKISASENQATFEENLQKLLSQLQKPKEKRIALPVNHSLQFFDFDEIIRIESESNYSHIFLMDKRKITLTKTLKDVEEKFLGQDFFRVHQSHFINLNHIDKIYKGENAYLVMKDGTQISISRHRKDEFLDLIKKI